MPSERLGLADSPCANRLKPILLLLALHLGEVGVDGGSGPWGAENHGGA